MQGFAAVKSSVKPLNETLNLNFTKSRKYQKIRKFMKSHYVTFLFMSLFYGNH